MSAIHVGGTHCPRTFRPAPPRQPRRRGSDSAISLTPQKPGAASEFPRTKVTPMICILSNIPRPRRTHSPPPPSIYAQWVIGILTGNTANGRLNFKSESINERGSLSFSQREGRQQQQQYHGPFIWAGSTQQPHSALATRGGRGDTNGPGHLIGASDRLADCHAGEGSTQVLPGFQKNRLHAAKSER